MTTLLLLAALYATISLVLRYVCEATTPVSRITTFHAMCCVPGEVLSITGAGDMFPHGYLRVVEVDDYTMLVRRLPTLPWPRTR